jgi:hypothetical protein
VLFYLQAIAEYVIIQPENIRRAYQGKLKGGRRA